MTKPCEVAEFYEVHPAVNDAQTVHANPFITLMETSREKLSATYDSLAYLAGIKSAPLDNHYDGLDTSSLQSLLASAKRAGFNTQIVNV